MKKFILCAALLLGACAHTGAADISTDGTIVIDGQDIGKAAAARVPDLPAPLAKKAQALPPMDDPSLSGQQIAAMEADRAYNGVAHQLNAVIDAWHCVQQSMNDNEKINKCFKDVK